MTAILSFLLVVFFGSLTLGILGWEKRAFRRRRDFKSEFLPPLRSSVSSAVEIGCTAEDAEGRREDGVGVAILAVAERVE
jgi:hypothetical protein